MTSTILHIAAVLILCGEVTALWCFLCRWDEKRRKAVAAEAAADAAEPPGGLAEAEPPAEIGPAGATAETEAPADPAAPKAASPQARGAGGAKRSRRWRLVFCGLTLLLAQGVYTYAVLARDYTFLYAFMESSVFAWLAVIGWIDARDRLIPNPLILAGLVFWAVITLMEIIIGGTPARQVLVYSLLGGGITFVILYLLALVMKSGLGMGDVKLFSVLGLCYGLVGVYSLLVASLLAMAAVATVMMIAKRATMKSTLPMAPFAMVGFLVNLFFSL